MMSIKCLFYCWQFRRSNPRRFPPLDPEGREVQEESVQKASVKRFCSGFSLRTSAPRPLSGRVDRVSGENRKFSLIKKIFAAFLPYNLLYNRKPQFRTKTASRSRTSSSSSRRSRSSSSSSRRSRSSSSSRRSRSSSSSSSRSRSSSSSSRRSRSSSSSSRRRSRTSSSSSSRRRSSSSSSSRRRSRTSSSSRRSRTSTSRTSRTATPNGTKRSREARPPPSAII